MTTYHHRHTGQVIRCRAERFWLFVFGPLYLLRYRLWTEAAMYTIASVAAYVLGGTAARWAIGFASPSALAPFDDAARQLGLVDFIGEGRALAWSVGAAIGILLVYVAISPSLPKVLARGMRRRGYYRDL